MDADEIEVAALTLSPSDVASWEAFLSTVHVGGALPVTFRLEDDRVVIEMMAPYVPPAPSGDPNKIPLGLAEGFLVPITARIQLPPFVSDDAPHFLRHIVRETYLHELDEQFRVGDTRPFAPEHG